MEYNKSPKSVVVELPFNEWLNVSSIKIFITIPRLVHDTLYKLIKRKIFIIGKLK